LVSTQWQWSVDLYKNRKETAIYKRRKSTQNNTQNSTQNTEYRKEKADLQNKKTNIKRLLKNIIRVNRK